MLTEKVNSAITDQMIRELRSRLQIGDLVQVLKWDGWKGQKRDESAARRIVCPIVMKSKRQFPMILELFTKTWISWSSGNSSCFMVAIQ